MVESVVRDLRYAVRLLGRSPGFTLTAIVALALGIGINTTIFSVANAVVLQPLSAAEPDRLVRVYSNAFSNTSYAEYADYRDGNRTLDELAAFQLAQFSLRVGAAPEPVSAELVSANYFATLGVHAALGQMPRAVDDLTAEPLVVLDHRFWVRRFDADPDIVGRTLSLNGQPFTVAGVAPDAFTGVMAPFVPALWVPLGAVPRLYPGDSLTVPGGNSLSLHLDRPARRRGNPRRRSDRPVGDSHTHAGGGAGRDREQCGHRASGATATPGDAAAGDRLRRVPHARGRARARHHLSESRDALAGARERAPA